MSTIAAGTTSGTALVSTGNTDGTLQFQVNGTTPSVTLNTLGAVGVGSSPSYGTSGQVLTSGGSTVAPTWATPAVTSPAGSTGQVQYNNAGAFGAVSSGTSGQVLTSAGSGAAPTWTTIGGSAMVRLGTQTVNGSSAINLDFISSTYTNYMLIIEGIYSYTGATVSPILQYRCSGTTDTNNAYGYCYTQGTGASWSGSAISSDNRINLSPTSPNGTNYLTAYFGVINISTFLNDNTNQYIVKANSHVQNANGGRGQAYPNLVYATYQGSFGLNSAVTGVSVTLSNSGTFVGKVTLYGLT